MLLKGSIFFPLIVAHTRINITLKGIKLRNRQIYTTLTTFSTKYLVMYKVYTDVGGIK